MLKKWLKENLTESIIKERILEHQGEKQWKEQKYRCGETGSLIHCWQEWKMVQTTLESSFVSFL